MNYFELFDIPVSFSVDRSALSKKYLELQKRYHPDFHGTADETAQEEALQLSAMVNKAWKTFQSEDETIKYMLQLKGLLEEEEKYQLPPVFLMEVMELNEMKMDGAPAAVVENRTTTLLAEVRAAVQDVLTGYAEGSIHSTADLMKVKDYYYKKKYLTRLAQQ
jgi:molecular chaperone HscB